MSLFPVGLGMQAISRGKTESAFMERKEGGIKKVRNCQAGLGAVCPTFCCSTTCPSRDANSPGLVV